MRLQRENRWSSAQACGLLQITDSVHEAAVLGVRETLKGKRQRRIRFELQPLASQFDRVVIAACETMKRVPHEWVCIDRGSRSTAR